MQEGTGRKHGSNGGVGAMCFESASLERKEEGRNQLKGR